MWRPLIHQTSCANTFIRMGFFFPLQIIQHKKKCRSRDWQTRKQKVESEQLWIGSRFAKWGLFAGEWGKKTKARTSWGILVNSFQINCTFVCRLRVENILQQSWRPQNMFWSSKREATVHPASFLHSTGWKTFEWKLWCNRWVHRAWGASVYSGQHPHLCLAVQLLTAGEEEWKETRASRSFVHPFVCSLCSKWPDLSPHRHSLPGSIWRHLTEAHRQISSSISIQSIPLFPSLDIKTYGSHYLQIGCDGRRRRCRGEKGRPGLNVTDSKLVIQ